MRKEFKEPTKRLIAERAGFRCSFPTCHKVTIGPGARHDESCSTGEAAHIYSASPNGPRGIGSLSDEQLISHKNGIWLCETHAKLVDTNRGESFPAPLLHSWKDLHEARIATEQSGMPRFFHWIQDICVHRSRIFRSGSKLTFGKVTLLFGKNGSGKTAICNWLSAISSPKILEKWYQAIAKKDLSFSVTFFNPEEHKIDVTFSTDEVQYYLDGNQVPFNPLPVKFVFVEIKTKGWGDEQTDWEYIHSHFEIDSIALRNCAGILGNQLHNFVQRLTIDDSEISARVMINIDGRNEPCPFGALSGSEQSRVIIELGAAMAYSYSKYIPTVFVLELGGTFLDDTGVSNYAEWLLSKEFSFQTIVLSPDPRDKVDWTGWELAEFFGDSQDVTIGQNL